MREITAIVIHCSATKPSMDIGLKEIRQWHVEGNGWSDVGYHYIIRRSGEVEKGRPDATPGAHVAGHNAKTIGICLVGGLNAAGKPAPEYTEAQWVALRTLIQELLLAYPQAEVKGHRDYPGVKKDCPCFSVGDWLG